MIRYGISFGLSLLFLVFAGCGGNVGLSGKVYFSDDKSPVPLGTVGLEADSGSHIARGDIQPNGTFVVGSLKSNDGLPPGKYRGSVSASKHVGNGIFETLIDPKFGNVATSGITIDITKKTRNFNIEVDRYVPSATKGKNTIQRK